MPDHAACCCAFFAAAVAAVGGMTAAQKPAADARLDPYTKGDAEAMRAAGIEAYAPMHWAGEHTTDDVERELALERKVAWAETRHFKIGICLPPRPWPTQKEEKKAINDEVRALSARLPEIKRSQQTLGSWLLVHLYAQRLEALYADFCGRVGFVDEAPPCEDGKGHDGRTARGLPLGTGRYLGQHGKYCLLILERRSDLARYFRAFAERDAIEGTCHHFASSNSLVFVTTPDIRTGGLETERALHCNVVYGVVRNLVTGFRGFTYDVPIWNVEGMAHCYRRRLDPAYNTIAGLPERQWGLLHDADWGQKAKARATVGTHARGEDLLAWRFEDLTDFHQHVMMWSRMEFLLQQGNDKLARYLAILKSLPTTGVPREVVLETQQRALGEVYGYDASSFDAAWIAFVRKKY